jgi:hypothetical protein
LKLIGHEGKFPHDIDVIVIGTPDRDDTTDAVTNALHPQPVMSAQLVPVLPVFTDCHAGMGLQPRRAAF